MTSRYTHLTLRELEADYASLESALQAAGSKLVEHRSEKQRQAAMETLMAIDGPLYGEGIANNTASE
jgi:hypothetical protein